MGTLEYSKCLGIKNKVFCEDDILQLAQFFSEQFSENDYQNDISMKFDDGSKITGHDISIFSTNEFKRRRCEAICFAYRSAHFRKKLDIRIFNAELSTSTSEIEVVSTEQMWYESTINRISTLIDEVEERKKVEKITNCVVPILAMVESILFCNTLYKFFPDPIGGDVRMLCSTVSAIVFLLLNMYLAWELCRLYPKVEFNFGPEHKKTSQKIRKILAILVPFVIDCIFFVVGLKT